MKTISNLSTALIIAAAILLVGNMLCCNLTVIASASMGFYATSAPTTSAVLLYCLSAILFVLGIALAIVSYVIEGKNK